MLIKIYKLVTTLKNDISLLYRQKAIFKHLKKL